MSIEQNRAIIPVCVILRVNCLRFHSDFPPGYTLQKRILVNGKRILLAIRTCTYIPTYICTPCIHLPIWDRDTATGLIEKVKIVKISHYDIVSSPPQL